MQGGVKIDHHLPVHPLSLPISLSFTSCSQNTILPKTEVVKVWEWPKIKQVLPTSHPALLIRGQISTGPCWDFQGTEGGSTGLDGARPPPQAKLVFRSQPEPIESHLRTRSMATMVAAPPPPNWETLGPCTWARVHGDKRGVGVPGVHPAVFSSWRKRGPLFRSIKSQYPPGKERTASQLSVG